MPNKFYSRKFNSFLGNLSGSLKRQILVALCLLTTLAIFILLVIVTLLLTPQRSGPTAVESLSEYILPIDLYSSTTDFSNKKVGDTFVVEVKTNIPIDSTEAFAVQIGLDYDPQVLEIVETSDIEPGSGYLGLNALRNNSDGYAKIDVAKTDVHFGYSGEESLATINFRIKSRKNTVISIDRTYTKTNTSTVNYAGSQDKLTINFVKTSVAPSPVYRFWSAQNQTHFYTSTREERDLIMRNYPTRVWKYEGVAFNSISCNANGASPVYRFWSSQNQSHFYTASKEERDLIVKNYIDLVWRFEGVGLCAVGEADVNSKRPVYRFWSAQNQSHFYTMSAEERDLIIRSYPEKIWKYEGIAFYAL